QTRQLVSDRMRIVYLQLPLFDKHTEAECMDIFDCWIYIMKNMNMFEQMPFSEKYPVFRKLAEIGDLRKLSREELELYDEDIKNMRDIYATRKFDEKRGIEKGRAEGMAEGMAKGMAKGIAKGELSKGLDVARNLLAMGMSWTQIIQATGLTEDQLKQLQS
ncbi:PD-(D/E)XK nuclease family transposase, partial [Prevotella copri]|uniref:PD-(D/E)XK nuclease family transposase n=1 Tax=Segatella copri TaxID=165179 RepID=UPI001C391D1E